MTKSRIILEKAIVALLNGHKDEAGELFHNYLVINARAIHESFRDEDLNVEADLQETYFTEADLNDLEDDAGDIDAAADDLGADLDVADLPAVEDDLGDLELGGEELEADLGGEELEGDLGGEASIADLADSMEDIQSQLAQLTTEFERMMNEITGEDVVGDEDLELDADVDLGGDEVEVDADVDGDVEVDAEVEDDEHLPESVSYVTEEDEFDDITESLMNELDKVKFSNVNGVGSDGKSIPQNNKSTAIAKSVNNRDGAKPIQVKSKNKTDFKREAPLAPHTDAKLKNERKQPAKIEPVASSHIGTPAEPSKFVPVKKK